MQSSNWRPYVGVQVKKRKNAHLTHSWCTSSLVRWGSHHSKEGIEERILHHPSRHLTCLRSVRSCLVPKRDEDELRTHRVEGPPNRVELTKVSHQAKRLKHWLRAMFNPKGKSQSAGLLEQQQRKPLTRGFSIYSQL